MRPRRLSARHYRRAFARALQLVRMQGLVAGTMEPFSEREQLFLDLHRLGRRPDPEDFILSWPLLRLEKELAQIGGELDGPLDASA